MNPQPAAASEGGHVPVEGDGQATPPAAPSSSTVPHSTTQQETRPVATTEDTTPDKAIADREPFASFIASHRYGALGTELTRAFAEVLEAVQRHEKKGSITLTFNVKTAGHGQIVVTDNVKTSMPDAPAPETFYFDDGNGGLSRRDPRQPQLPYLND